MNPAGVRVCVVHNEYARPSGEERAVRCLVDALSDRGHAVDGFFRSSATIAGLRGKAKAFGSGIYSREARRTFARRLEAFRPDLVHVHNLFPLISPSILYELAARRIPTVMTVHNYRLVCPNGLMFSHGEVCHRCAGGREWKCAVRNCENDRAKSIGYAARSWVARVGRAYERAIDRYIVLSELQGEVLMDAGIPAERIRTLPHPMSDSGTPMKAVADHRRGEAVAPYVGFAGRIAPEKGVETLVEAARRLPAIPFRFAGDCWRMPALVEAAPPNCQFSGFLDRAALGRFLSGARFIVAPSICYETSSLIALEAMEAGKAVLASRRGALSELVEDAVTGILCEPGNSAELAARIQFLWERPALAARMGAAGRERVRREYSEVQWYGRLLDIYGEAMSSRAA